MKKIRAIRPNEGVRMRYQRTLKRMIREMSDSVEYWAAAVRRQNPPAMAQDATPSERAMKSLDKLSSRWKAYFEEMAESVARKFVQSQFKATDVAFRSALREAGWSLPLKMSAGVKDAFEASVIENVSLIKSIPDQYFSQIEGIVMRNYTAGLDVKTMVKEIRGHYQVSERRAVLIARDQTAKANSTIYRARQLEIGITEAIWLHSRAGKEPRRSHVAMDGKVYKVEKGMWDPDARQWIFPGQLINCGCMSESVLPLHPFQND